jgi:hypothetical protein
MCTSQFVTQTRNSLLWTERASWDSHWRDISEYMQPRAGRFVVTDRNRGDKRHNAISTPRPGRGAHAGRRHDVGHDQPGAAVVQAGHPRPRPDGHGPVKTWLHHTGELLRDIYAASNTYRALHSGYMELGLFGTWATVLLPDFDNVIHHTPLTVGEYSITTDDRGRVNTLAREFQMTVGQMAERFGADALSPAARNLYDRGSLDTWVTVNHLVEPNKDRDPKLRDNRNLRWSSRYFETTARASGCVNRASSAFPRSRRAGRSTARTSTAARRAWRRWAT